MSHRSDSRRPARSGGVNAALALFLSGFFAECFFLLIHRLLLRGTTGQIVFAARALEVLQPVGLGLFGAGLVLFLLRRRFSRPHPALFAALVLSGAVLCVSCRLMRRVPASTTVLCILVPAAMLLLAVWLLYQREFAVQASELSLLILCASLLSRGGSGNAVRALTVLAMLALCAVAVLLVLLRRSGGCFTRGDRFLRLLPVGANYALLLGITAGCLAAGLAALFFSAAAYYVVWAAALALFCLAVWYTVKLM